MKTSFALEFSDALECADFFTALGDAFRRLAGGAQRAVAAVAGTPSIDELMPDGPTDNDGSDPATGKPRRARRTKAEMEAARAAEAAPATQAAPTQVAAGPVGALPADYLLTDLRNAGDAVVKKTGPEAVMEILKSYGVRKYGEVVPGQRDELLAKLKAALA